MATHVANARKSFNFKIEINGLDQFECQKITLPETEIEKVEHGDTNFKVKTAGQVKLGEIKIEKLKRLPGSDTWAWQWLKQAQNMETGGGGLAANYKRTVIIKEMTPSGLGTLNSWVCDGCWVSKISQSDFSRTDSENLIQSIELSVDTIAHL